MISVRYTYWSFTLKPVSKPSISLTLLFLFLLEESEHVVYSSFKSRQVREEFLAHLFDQVNSMIWLLNSYLKNCFMAISSNKTRYITHYCVVMFEDLNSRQMMKHMKQWRNINQEKSRESLNLNHYTTLCLGEFEVQTSCNFDFSRSIYTVWTVAATI